jgi:3-oxoacyl-[acyl-carrier protein] reductase
MIDLKGHVSIVTGAGAGLGRGAAIGLAAAGADVGLIDINSEGLAETVRMIEAKSARSTVRTYSADVSSRTSVADTFDRISQDFPAGIDSVVNVAGVEFFKELNDVTDADWERQIAVNLKSVFLCAQQAGRLMQNRGGGSIVNTSSVQGFATTGRTAPYAAAKGGVLSMSRDLARDLGPENIRVNCICPGCIHSPMLDRSYASAEERRQGLATLASVLPLRRVGEPEDFANLVLFLVSPMASYVTGQAIAIDGGMLCRLPLA